MRVPLLIVIATLACAPEGSLGTSEEPGGVRILSGQLRLVLDPGVVDFPVGSDGYPRRGWQREGLGFHDEYVTLKGILERHGIGEMVKLVPMHHEGQLERWIRAERDGLVQWTLSRHSDEATRTYYVRFGGDKASLTHTVWAMRELERLDCIQDVSFSYLVPDLVH